ncbi:hypothetical protein HBI70_134470 [Parastagonospora nodorum]|nr:hypothetical protein HBH51_196810 [Parastagonospora nodorum]KAH4104537.1 hypothetical protein HBH46_101900 [Parastagonospora nodorum]KAH4810922.1 hypothetical protein HBH61_096490 [Parastagonospora nodorum]KAH5115514.1 hypothetical protein HBH71_134260 [Parastagonospora nodorum]KAH5216375.1 hypothetical protein HBI62_171120 [Parastagonospora nodorum]
MGAMVSQTKHQILVDAKTHESRGFLDLPPELRLKVYRHISPTHSGFDYDDWRGLYSSCRLVKYEMDNECSKLIQIALRDVLSHECVFAIEAIFFNGTGYIHKPTKFPHLKIIHVTLHFDVDAYWKDRWTLLRTSFLPHVSFRKDLFYEGGKGTAFDEVLAPLLPWAISELIFRFRANRVHPAPVKWNFEQAAYFVDGTVALLHSRLQLNGNQNASPINKHLRKMMVDIDSQQSLRNLHLLNVGSIHMTQRRRSNTVHWIQGAGAFICVMGWSLKAHSFLIQDITATKMDYRTRTSFQKLDQFCATRKRGGEAVQPRG